MTHYALTGSIGTGKSTVLAMLKSKLPSFLFYSIDEEVAAMYKDPEVCQQLLEKFGTCNKVELSKLFFSDAIAKNQIEQIFNKRISDKLSEILTKKANTITEYPVLFEYHQEHLFDKVIVISADTDIRVKRVMARNGLSEKEVLAKIAAQLPDELKIKKSDFVVYNNTDIHELELQIKELAAKIALAT